MAPAQIECAPSIYAALVAHLLPARPRSEEAAFLYAQLDRAEDTNGVTMRVTDYELLSPSDFELRSLYSLYLRDGVRARVIKRAHDLGACLVEAHSHPFPYPAELSNTD